MIDPGQLASAFLSGPTLTSDDVDVVNDKIAYFWWDAGRQRYIAATITPQELWEAINA